uniref:BZIP domain-containing protein n=1 Tax=Ascaris lumbricoides TaxID=6252 RepID=A0A0M3HK46_ASCLU
EARVELLSCKFPRITRLLIPRPSQAESSQRLFKNFFFCFSPREEWGTVRRTRAISLAGMSNAEITDRKRQQNRAAAVRYRRKLKDKRHREKVEKMVKQALTLKNSTFLMETLEKSER